jgi:hypothetical protein
MSGRIKNREPEPRLPLARIGKIKIGLKNPEKGYPMSVDYFVCQGSKYDGLFHSVYGEKPQTLQIIFIDDDPALSCPEEWEYRDDDGRLFASGDGENFKVWNAQDARYVSLTITELPDLMERVARKCPAKNGWYVSLKLRFILPRISGVVGYWEFATKGQASTIPNIRDAFDAMLENRGFVRGVIFDLNVEFAKSNKPGVTSRYPVVTLVPNHSSQNVEMVKGALLEVKPALQLTGGQS